MIGIDRDQVRFLILKARQLNAKDQPTGDAPDGGSNMSDDNFLEVLDGDVADASEEEIRSIIDDMNVDERAHLVALAWVGRGDYGADEWGDAVTAAREERTTPTADYLLGMPLLGDYLDEGFAAFGYSLAGEENAADLPEGAPGVRREDPGAHMPISRTGGSAGASVEDEGTAT